MAQEKFASLSAAFAALPEEIREHGLRVEKYAVLILNELIASEEYQLNMNSRVRLKPENRELIGEAARYHDIGKTLIPDIYHYDSEDYAPEERQLYRRHSAAGEELLRELLAKERGMTPQKADIFAEAALCHHECWEGGGYPEGTAGEKTPVVGRIVCVADALDHLLMTTKTETPAETALDRLLDGSGTVYDPVIIGLLFEAVRKLDKQFALYRGTSKAVPKAARIIKRKARRPLYLEYRPIADLKSGTVTALEADMRFRRGRDTVGWAEAAHIIKEKKLERQTGEAFVLEAGDMYRRMSACGVGGDFVALNCPPGFLRRRGAGNAVRKLLESSDTAPAGLCFILTAEDAATDKAGIAENCRILRDAGAALMLTGVSPDEAAFAAERLCITDYRLPAEFLDSLGRSASALKALSDRGITLHGEGVTLHRHKTALTAAGIRLAVGELLGEYTTEDGFITGELATERE